MTLAVLVLLPALGALGAAAHRTEAYRAGWLLVVAALHLALTTFAWTSMPPPEFGGWLALDALGLIVLTVISVLFAATAAYTIGYRRIENARGRVFVSCLLSFLAAASLVSLSHHFALLWIALEATTLSVAPLVFHRRDRRSLEAVWKYLVLSSVGIALALLGTFLLAASQPATDGAGQPLLLEDLIRIGPQLHPAWLKAACVFLLVGFGTKMGLVPLHGWKPGTYEAAPSLVAGLMAGALTSCAFLGLLRMFQVAVAARIGSFVTPLLLAFGLVSIGVATALLAVQRDLRRLLAYSSVEHMGLLTLGLGLGGSGVYGSLLHIVNNGVAKGLMFLTAGNAIIALGDDPPGQRGLLRKAPVTGTLLLLGLLAVTGSPPFGTFLSEFIIIRGAFWGGHPWIGAAALLGLTIAFVGMARLILPVVYGAGPAAGAGRAGDRAWLVVPPLLLALALLALGMFTPPALASQLRAAVATLGGGVP